jgi:putative transcriptional regulator
MAGEAMNIFDEALVSLQEAIEYEKGDAGKGCLVVRELKPVSPLKEYTGEDIKRIREAHNYTQSYFGALLGVSLKCVQSWEYNMSRPNGSARRIISLVEKGEDFLEKAEIITRKEAI